MTVYTKNASRGLTRLLLFTRFPLVLLMILFTGRLCICISAAEVMDSSANLNDQELTPQVRAAVKHGLDWLAQNQNSDGSFQNGGSSAAITALAGLAFVAGGNLPDQGPYAHQTAAALHYILNQCQQSGLIAASGDGSPMYGHGFATLFLSEVYGESGDPDLRSDLE